MAGGSGCLRLTSEVTSGGDVWDRHRGRGPRATSVSTNVWDEVQIDAWEDAWDDFADAIWYDV
jgi:hypothetical protein